MILFRLQEGEGEKQMIDPNDDNGIQLPGFDPLAGGAIEFPPKAASIPETSY